MHYIQQVLVSGGVINNEWLLWKVCVLHTYAGLYSAHISLTFAPENNCVRLWKKYLGALV